MENPKIIKAKKSDQICDALFRINSKHEENI